MSKNKAANVRSHAEHFLQTNYYTGEKYFYNESINEFQKKIITEKRQAPCAENKAHKKYKALTTVFLTFALTIHIT